MHRGGAGAGALAPHGQNAALQLLQRERIPAGVRLPAGVFCAQRVAGPHGTADLWSRGPRCHRVLQRTAGVPPRVRLHRLYCGPDRIAAAGPKKCGGCPVRQPGGPEHSSLRRADRFSDLRRHLPGRQSGREGARLPARHLHRGAGRGRFPHLFLHSGRDHRLHPAGRDPQPRREQSPVQR